MSDINQKRGFAMIMAIFVVVMISMVGTLLLQNASQGVKLSTDNYLRLQAELLAQSASEFALMHAQDTNTSAGNCLNDVNITVNDASGKPVYDINVALSYSYKNNSPTLCVSRTIADNTGTYSMVLIDTTVTSHKDANISTEPIRVQKRTWQKL
ncbi:type II secretion system protein [Sulfuricurvum sp.]|uniref:type II secretion system protein n=1 Tax=Sulfuricurvum sp. TaxID=2025608 RepID=UPI001998A433|nr:type II secretion system protein [Sulfuricurvum sp.]MBD3798819.1 type II secretion system protein [Campylobacterota bacterium]MBD3806506.1 type II secretion system protein [Sulfuricurvum sp.]